MAKLQNGRETHTQSAGELHQRLTASRPTFPQRAQTQHTTEWKCWAIRARLSHETLSGDLRAGLTVAQIAERHGDTKDYIYGRMRRLGLKVNPRPFVDWTGLVEQLRHRRPREIAADRAVSVSAVYWAAHQRGIRHLIAPARTIDHDRVRADLASGMKPCEVAEALEISLGSVYRIRHLEPR